MSLFLDDGEAAPASARDYSMLHQMGCRACPLARVSGNRHPKMEATGDKRPLVYFLGEGPGRVEDQDGEQFVGPSGELLRARVPRKYRDRVRYNNVVNCRPPKNRNPTQVEVECCRGRVVADIERARPRAVVGLGNVPLEWVSGFTGIAAWRGRRMPARIGSHVCWYYPITHPAFVLRQRRREMGPSEIGSEDERMFALDMRRVFDEAESLPEPSVHDAAEARRGIETISGHEPGDLERVRSALRWAAKLPVVGVDYETHGLRPYAADARLLSAAVGDADRMVALALDHPDAGWRKSERKEVGTLWAEFLRGARGVKVAHNEQFELEWTGVCFGADLVRAGRWECTQVQASVVDERSRGGRKGEGPLSLDFLTQQYFGFSVKDVFPVDRKNLIGTSLELVLRYNCPDAKYAALLWEKQRAEIERLGLEGVYDLSLRRVPTVVLTQMRGVPISQPVVRDLRKKYDKMIGEDDDWARGGSGWRRGEIGRQIAKLSVIKDYERRYGKYNPMSNQHVLRVMHDMLGRKECATIDKYTKERKLSVDEGVLEQIDHPLARLTLDLRKVMKLRSTYVDPLREGAATIYPDGCLHVNFNTMIAETGRLSSSEINIQNIPKRSDMGKEVRRAFVAERGKLIVAVDYGQIEARVIAMLTQDKRFCKALWERYDVHMEWAQRIARAYPAIIGGKKFIGDKPAMKKLRQDMKSMWVFALFFGAQRASVAGYLKVPEDVVAPLYEEFWEQFSGVREWQEEQVRLYRKRGYVECATGRRRHGPLSYNMVINTPVQGTAAEIVMDGMCRLSETGDPDLQPEINVHDDLTFMRVDPERVDDVVEKVVGHMIDVPFDFVNVPITVEVSVGTNWQEMEAVGTFSSDEWFGK